ncbi:MAG: membrane protein insertion efficiency factor YidD [Spirochaetales bacterium]|nr:membrane protein insertion efficiency factor YidD [Spirochaetales bacterium]
MYKKIIFFNIELLITIIKTLCFIPRGCCRFYPSCTEYSKEAFYKLPMKNALWATIIRVLKCHPFNRGGYEPFIEENYK